MSGSNPENILNSTVSSISSSTISTVPSNLMASVTANITRAAAMAIDPLSHVGDGIFLQTKTAQGLAGICVWVALFLTCQQVNQISL